MKDVDKLFDVKGQVAIITGTSSGLGQLYAEVLASRGAKLALCARRADKVNELAKALKKKYKAEIFTMAVDINEEKEVKKFVSETYKRFGRIDILVNNAGIADKVPAIDAKKEAWQSVINTNLVGTFIVAREVAKYMMKRGYGKIINISSIYGSIASPSPRSSYFASKGGVVNLTRGLAVEWAPYNINVNAIAPGHFAAGITNETLKNKEYTNAILSKIPLKRMGAPDDLIGLLMLLCSHASDYITGQIIFIDGGVTVW